MVVRLPSRGAYQHLQITRRGAGDRSGTSANCWSHFCWKYPANRNERKRGEGMQQLSATVFHWRRDREGWLEAAELAEPVAQSNPSEGTRFQYLEKNGQN